jgi:hypothetical protein
MRAFSVVLAHASFLPSAECFALLPLAGQLGRTGNDNGADLDYDAATGTVLLKAGRPYRCGRWAVLRGAEFRGSAEGWGQHADASRMHRLGDPQRPAPLRQCRCIAPRTPPGRARRCC